MAEGPRPEDCADALSETSDWYRNWRRYLRREGLPANALVTEAALAAVFVIGQGEKDD